MNNDIKPFLLLWDHLSSEDMQERIDWLRKNLTAGIDWGFCANPKICVLKTSTANLLYRLRWFEPGQQKEIDWHPTFENSDINRNE